MGTQGKTLYFYAKDKDIIDYIESLERGMISEICNQALYLHRKKNLNPDEIDKELEIIEKDEEIRKLRKEELLNQKDNLVNQKNYQKEKKIAELIIEEEKQESIQKDKNESNIIKIINLIKRFRLRQDLENIATYAEFSKFIEKMAKLNLKLKPAEQETLVSIRPKFLMNNAEQIRKSLGQEKPLEVMN